MVHISHEEVKKDPDGTTTTSNTGITICTIFKSIPLRNIETEITLDIRLFS